MRRRKLSERRGAASGLIPRTARPWRQQLQPHCRRLRHRIAAALPRRSTLALVRGGSNRSQSQPWLPRNRSVSQALDQQDPDTRKHRAMNARLIGTTLAIACVLGAGAGMASYYAGRDRATDGHEAIGPVPLFLTSAQGSDARPAWPTRSGPVAFNHEMIALLTLGATMSGAARQAMAQGTIEQPRRMTRRERRQFQREERARQRAERAYEAYARAPDMRGRVEGSNVEVRVYDRYGNNIRTRRVQREIEADLPRAYSPRRARAFGRYGRW